jgi:hypothetical protein
LSGSKTSVSVTWLDFPFLQPMIVWSPCHIRFVCEPFELRLHFLVLTFCLFDCLMEGITRLNTNNHIPSHLALAMVKCGGSHFVLQECCHLSTILFG